MRKWLLLLFDLSIVSISPFLSILIRDNFLLFWEKQYNLVPYALICVGVSAFVFIAAHVHRSVWRYLTMPDYTLIVKAVTVSVGMTVCIVFLSGLQHGIALSVPIIQWAVIISLMIFIRLSAQYICRTDNANSVQAADKENVLILGLSDSAELYLHWVRKLAKDKINVIGLLDENRLLKGRHIQSCQVIGHPVELSQLLARYKIHGITVGRIIMAVPFDTLSKEGQSILKFYETRGDIQFEYLEEKFENMPEVESGLTDIREEIDGVLLSQKMAPVVSPNWYHAFKRSGDVALSLLLMVMLSPLIVIVGLFVLLDRGYPITFWQQRLGKDGKSFRLYKFRTMSDGVDTSGKRIPDDRRISTIGRFLRRVHFDELPQLYNILRGEMSFVGPRPLLISDQPEKSELRLLVRPGLTGWAQVNGGQAVSPEDKAVLDLWYLNNISLGLDLKIMMMTFRVLLFGERLNQDMISKARMELSQSMSAEGVTSVTSKSVISHTTKQRVA